MSQKYIIEQDGDEWFGHYENFKNLQESIAFFGKTPEKAFKKLMDYEEFYRRM